MNIRRPLLTLLVCIPMSALAADRPAAAIKTPLASSAIRQLMQDGKYTDAVQAIDEALKVKDAPREYLTYLKGRALHLDKKYDEAIALFEQLAKDSPKTVWSRRARFGKAVSLARKGDFRNAELIYRAEAEYLLSADRKQQIADIYLEFADAYFHPPKEEQNPDYAKALEFYKKVIEVGPKAEKQIEVELKLAECQQKLGKHGDAAKLYEQFSKDHPTSPLDIEARFHLGECRLAEGNRREARRVWQDLLAKHAESQSERIAQSRFQLSRTWSIPQPNNDEELNLGTAALSAFLERFPKHKLAGQAHLEIAQSFLHRGRHEEAIAALKQFLADPRCKECRELPDGQHLLGRCYQSQKKFAEALTAWREFLAKYPAHNAWSEVQRQIIETEYLTAFEKLRAKQYEAANKLFNEFLAKYPLDDRNPDILLQMNEQNVVEKKWDEAIANWRRVVSKYPLSPAASRAQFWIAETFEKRLDKLDEALEEYRKVIRGSAMGEARQAIGRMTGKSMTVATERVFRSDETPKLKLVTRNVESVTVRAYKVDLETYFRKMHLARGIEGLDIALIDPDATFEFKVPKYAKYRQIESAIEVPLPAKLRAGVMAVTVSSKTLEATTLVMQSDLDMIVKSSRDELFVFAENMLTGKPWAGARLLVSDGREVIGEVTTGADGVFQKTFKDLLASRAASTGAALNATGGLNATDIRVLAVSDGHVASNVVDLRAVGFARGLTDKGYIYTDRPAYRAGQLVNVRGCLRHAVDDVYTVEKDKPFTVQVFDSRNRLVRQEKIKLDAFGSFHAHFMLPPTSPQGDYRVLVQDNAKQTYQGTFRVHEYQLEPIRLVVDTLRKVYYRGEPIEGTIRAEFYYGAPLVGREVRYQLAGDRLQTATTDAKGEVRIKLPTREYSETQVLPLQVNIPDANVQTTVNFVLAAQGFTLDVSTVRPVYVAGETFEITVKAKDAEGKPLAQKVKLKVLEQTTVEGTVGERLVEEHPLETAADGAARQTIKLAEGGRFILRAEGIDRFHNPISGTAAVQISGKEDTVRLRILADKHTFKAGDTAAVQLHWREQPALALVTFQGERVLEHRLIQLATGANRLDIPMTARLAPNFELAVAVMTDPRPEADGAKARPIVRFHEATSPFIVQRDLRVKIVASRKGDGQGPARPGDELEVTLKTTDPARKADCGRGESCDGRAGSSRPLPVAIAGDPGFLPRRPTATGRSHDIEYHVQLLSFDEADQSAASGRTRSARIGPRGRGKPTGLGTGELAAHDTNERDNDGQSNARRRSEQRGRSGWQRRA